MAVDTSLQLLETAKAKGYACGNYKCLASPERTYTDVEDDFFLGHWGAVWHGTLGYANKVYDPDTGQWAKVLPTITKYEAERLLGKVII